MNIQDVMTGQLETIRPDATLRQAAERMRAVGIGALAVAEGGELVGFITDRDITVRAVARGLDPNAARVREAMTAGVVTCLGSDPVEAAEDLMERKAVRRLVVLDEWHQPMGLISVDDLAVLPREASRAAEVLQHLNVP